jgi:hypothetical protein
MPLHGTKDWAVSEVVTAANLDAYMGPPPDLVDIDVFMTPISHVNFDTNTVQSLALYCGYRVSSSAQNDEINFDVVLAAGTWTFELMYVKQTGGGGIFTVQLSTDASAFTSIGSAPYNASGSTIDSYTAGATTYNVLGSLTGITIATTGRYRLKLLMATKNAGSANYTGVIQHIQLRRTA